MSSSHFVQDFKGVLTGHMDVMQRVTKTPSYFPVSILLMALVAGAQFLQQWQASERIKELLGFGMDTTFLIKQSVFGFVMAFVVLFFLHLAAVKWFKGTAVSYKGFLSIYGFTASPMLLVALPVPFVGLVGLIWAVVLFFKMFKAVFGHGAGKTLLVVITGGLIGALISVFLGSFIGLSDFYSTSDSTGFKFGTL